MAQILSRKYPHTRSIPVLSSASSPGIVLASGNMGRRLQYKTSVFLSADAGLSWHQVLQGNYYYNMGDHGGVIVAVKYFKTEGDTNTLLYSTDEGLTWRSHQFYPTPIRVFGLITEPGENTTIFTMFGSQTRPADHQIDWIIVKVDLAGVFERNCTLADYKHWSPVSHGRGKASRCVLGRRDSFLRRSPKANCYNGLGFQRANTTEICPCSVTDYQCEWGYTRTSRLADCRLIHGREVPAPPANCPPDTFYTASQGYRKVAGDECEGEVAGREPRQRACPTSLAQPATFMLIAQRKRIVKLDLRRPNSSLETLPLIGINNVIAMDLDYQTDCVFWADIDQDKIMKQCLANGSLPQVLVQSQLNSVEGMSYDHVRKILYFVDGSKRTVELVKVDSKEGRMRKTILNAAVLGERSKPRGIAVHPREGFLFYTDWADKAAGVGRARLDGSQHEVIVDMDDKGRRLLGWPNGIAIDFQTERLYFVDAQKDFIASCDLDGSRFHKIVSGRSEAAHPFAVGVYKDLVVWNDWTRKAIFQADKETGQGVWLVKDDIAGAMDMKIYSGYQREAEEDPCLGAGCSGLCVPMPRTESAPRYRCLCPDGMKVQGTECECPPGQRTEQNGTCSLVAGAACTTDQFQCNNRLCVSRLWRCDGDNGESPALSYATEVAF